MTLERLKHTKEDREDPRVYAKDRMPHYSDVGSHKKRSDYWKAERKVNEKKD